MFFFFNIDEILPSIFLVYEKEIKKFFVYKIKIHAILKLRMVNILSINKKNKFLICNFLSDLL